MNVREAARYLEKEVGEEASLEIIERMQEKYKVAKKKHMRADYQMGHNAGYMCDFEVLSEDEEMDGGHAEVKRP